MAVETAARSRVRVDGKFFRLDGRKFYVKGLTYGPFAPNAPNGPFASPEQTAADFSQIRDAGANLVRVYHTPPRWFLDLAQQHDLKVFIDIPWDQKSCFLDSASKQAEVRQTVCRAVTACARHPAVFAFSVVNEIPPDIVRWSSAKAITRFIDELIHEAKRIDPECLYTFTNFPSTEFLRPREVDFVCFNVYLHNEQPFKNYLARLQLAADSKPLVLGEFGMDSLREGEARKCETLAWQIEGAFRAGLAGAVVFSFTDDWFKDGRQIEDWQMGLTARSRQPKKSFQVVGELFRKAPHFPLSRQPKVSVVVASYNAGRTLNACLESLTRLNYPDYEVILVDDGSTDDTPKIAEQFSKVNCLRHEKNLGLSIARNTGIAAAAGEIIAFTDADCRADEDWLYYLVGDLLKGEFAGMGGPNLLPLEDGPVAAAVMVSPGGPAHVMLDNRVAEHIPGCNMAFHKQALVEIGGFDPVFHTAGDDVDICWRLQQAGYKIGFSPAAFVWHYRRSTVGAYLKQQRGYGEAEALLARKHPECFNKFGGSIWHGHIYTPSKFGVLARKPVIYHGTFGSAGFQTLYASEPEHVLMFSTSLEYHLFVTLPLWILSATFHQLLPLAIASSLTSLGVCIAAGVQASLPRNKMRWWSRPLVALLFFLQPLVRGWARHHGRLTLPAVAQAPEENLDSATLLESEQRLDEAQYLAEPPLERLSFVARVVERLEQKSWPNKFDAGWSDYDVEVHGNPWSRLQLTTVVLDHSSGRRLIRCRLRTAWSLQAQVAFWSLLGVELLVIGILWRLAPWLWLLLLGTPLLFWFLRHQQRQLQSLFTVFLDTLAKEIKLTKVPTKSTKSDNPQLPAELSAR